MPDRPHVSRAPAPRATAPLVGEPAWPLAEAAHVLGMLPWQAERILGEGPYDLEAVERAALEHYQPSAHRQDRFSYWLTSSRAAELLDVSPARVKRLVAADRLPYVTHRSGQRLLRRYQVEVIVNAQQSRTLRLLDPPTD